MNLTPWRPVPIACSVPHLAAQLGLAPVTSQALLAGVQPLAKAGPAHLSFLDNPKYESQLQSTRAGAVLVRPAQAHLVPQGTVALITPHPYVLLAQALTIFYPIPPAQNTHIHPTAHVHPSAQIGQGAHIGPMVVVHENVIIGSHTTVHTGCVLQHCTIGNHCVLHPGVKIGQDGFGFAQQGTTLHKVPQVGGVIIGHHVEIGANTTIDRGALEDTIIEDDVKIDNLVQIGHNAHIGRGTRIVAQVGVGGSTHIGAHNVLGGQSGFAGHLTTAPGVMVAAQSGVSKSITGNGMVVAGTPAQPINVWRRGVAALARLAKSKTQPEISEA